MHYHFIGIKGSGMASLATIVSDRGDEVSGSDIENIFTSSHWRSVIFRLRHFPQIIFMREIP
ncbi:MAG: Mur ligase domain-containing protein [Clostridium sp.]